jgi:ribonuclease HII
MKGNKADWSLEDYLGRKQGLIVAGCDEVGRGAFAFSLVVASCAYAPGVEMPYEIRDSKALTAEERERLVAVLTLEFVNHGQLHLAYAEAPAAEVEASNLNELNLRLFKDALQKLPRFDCVIIDGSIADKSFPFPGLCAPKADTRSITVATASIFAKVRRDRQMQELHKQYPQYGFNAHMGYGTKAHVEAICKFGPIPGVHRRNFLRNLP